MKTPNNINYLSFEATCSKVSFHKWQSLMQGATKANKQQINKLVKLHLPDLYESLSLNLYNPYNYYKTKTHLILVHSAIEYFLRYE